MSEDAHIAGSTLDRALLQSVDAAVVAVSADRTVIRWNAAAETLFGITAELAVGASLTAIGFSKEFQRLLDPSEFSSATATEMDVVVADGRRIRVRVQVSPVRSTDSQVDAVVATILDRTTIRDARLALRERTKELRTLHRVSECLQQTGLPLSERLQAVVDTMPHGWSFPDVTAVRLRLDGAQWQSEDFEQTPWMQTASLSTPEHGDGWLEVALREGRSTEPDGEPFLPEEQELLDTIAKQISAALTMWSVERQLRHAQKMEATGRLAAGVAHDFNNLLTVIIMQTEMLLDESRGDSQVREQLSLTLEACHRGAELTGQLLAFGREQVLQVSSVDPTSVIERTAGLARRVLPSTIEVLCEPHDQPLRIDADSGKLEQALLNLVLNARDAMPDGGTLRLATSRAAERDAVEIIVEDTGVGIAPETEQRMFEPFFTTKPRGAGSGLGLAMVYGITHQIGGTIRVDSEEGVGTTFTLTFRPSKGAVVEEQPKVATDVRETPVGPGRVLVVEDDPDVRRLTCAALERDGYEVAAAATFDAGLEVLRNTAEVRAVVTDIMLPGASGGEIARWVDENLDEVPVIVVSGNANLSGSSEGKRWDYFVAKPFSPTTLSTTVSRAIAEASSQGD